MRASCGTRTGCWSLGHGEPRQGYTGRMQSKSGVSRQRTGGECLASGQKNPGAPYRRAGNVSSSHTVSLWELLSKEMLKWRNIRLIGRGREMSWEAGASDVSERTRNLIGGGAGMKRR